MSGFERGQVGRCQGRSRRRDLLSMLYDSLSSAFDRVDDFLEIQGPKISVQAVELLQEAAGVTEAERRVIAQRVVGLLVQQPDEQPHTAAMLLGVLVGLFAVQFEKG